MKNTIYLARALPSCTKPKPDKSPAANMAERVSRVHAATGGNKAQRAASGGGSLSMLVPQQTRTPPQLAKADKQHPNLANPSTPNPHTPALHPSNPSQALPAAAPS